MNTFEKTFSGHTKQVKFINSDINISTKILNLNDHDDKMAAAFFAWSWEESIPVEIVGMNRK